jgi:hypothetical protein
MLRTGQFNSVHNTGRKNKSELLKGVEAVDSKVIARNTVRYTRPDGAVAVRLHSTDVVTTFPDGSIILDSGGWKTLTTKDRLRYALPTGWAVYSDKGVWYVQTPAGEFVWQDGARFRANGKPVGKLANVALINQQRADEKLIKRYCAKIVNEPWPEGSGGDPWVWPNPKTGKLSESDVRSFLREQYVFLTMFDHACKWAGMGDMYLAMAFRESPERAKGRHSLRRGVAAKVRRYLKACLGYAV